MKKLIILLFVVFFIVGCKAKPPTNTTGDDKKTLTIMMNPGVDTVEVNTLHIDKGAIALYGLQQVPYRTETNVDTTRIGNYQITYTAEYEDQSVSVTRKVYVIDETPPVITLRQGVDTIIVGTSWEDAGVIVTDNSLEQLSASSTGYVNVNVVSTYIITYTAEDSSGNTASAVRYVNVINGD